MPFDDLRIRPTRREDLDTIGDISEVASYAYCASWNSRTAYRQTVEDSIHLAPHAFRGEVGGRLLGELLAP